jgi:ABC-type transporter Mla MlaB component
MPTTTKPIPTAYKVARGHASWKLEGCLNVGAAAELYATALQLAKDPTVQKVSIELPNLKGVELAGFQILTALHDQLQSAGKPLEISGHLTPFGGRTW